MEGRRHSEPRPSAPGGEASASEEVGAPQPHAPAVRATEALQGLLIAHRYRIEARIGVGGLSRVYAGVDTETDERVAIKVIDPSLSSDPQIRQRLLDEAEDVIALASNHTVEIRDMGALPAGQLYVVMEYIEGVDLDTLLRREGPLPWSRVAAIGLQICGGLAAAHRCGIIHRDIKPQNCLRIAVDDIREQIKIVDFGIARGIKVAVSPTQEEFLIGTPEYMAPELVQGGAQVDERTDVYSLGITLYKLLTGGVPFHDERPIDTLCQHVEEPLVPPSEAAPDRDIPEEADALIARALAKDPAARFAGVEELARAIRTALGRGATGSNAVIPIEEPRRPGSGPSPLLVEPASLIPAEALVAITTAAPTEPVHVVSRGVHPLFLVLRIFSLALLSGLFMVGTWAVSPHAAAPVPQIEESPEQVFEATPAPPTRTDVPAHPQEVVGSSAVVEPAGPVEEPETAEPVVEPPDEPEADFNYRAARTLIEEQHEYLRATCMTKAKVPATKLKFRVDVRASGRAVIRVYSPDKPVRLCVRELFLFPFEASPHGGAFEYILTGTGASARPMPVQREELK